MENIKNTKTGLLSQNLDKFLKNEDGNKEDECIGEECKITTDKSIIKKEHKTIITEDGRQLLI